MSLRSYSVNFERECKGTPLYEYIKQNFPRQWRITQKWRTNLATKIITEPNKMLLPLLQQSGHESLREYWNYIDYLTADGGEILVEPKVYTVGYYSLKNLSFSMKKGQEKYFNQVKHLFNRLYIYDDLNDTVERSGLMVYLKPEDDFKRMKKFCYYFFNNRNSKRKNKYLEKNIF